MNVIIDPSQLTEEQRKEIYKEYAIAKLQAEVLHYTTYDVMRVLKKIFGEEMFEPKKKSR